MTLTSTTAPTRAAWTVAAVSFLAILAAAGFRAVPGVLMTPLHHEFGWSTSVMSLAVSVNLIFYGLVAPFAERQRLVGKPTWDALEKRYT